MSLILQKVIAFYRTRRLGMANLPSVGATP